MVTTSNIEPQQVAFSDPAHVAVIRPNLVYGGGGRWCVCSEIEMKHGVTEATGAAGAATRWARRQHHQYVSAMLVVGLLG